LAKKGENKRNAQLIQNVCPQLLSLLLENKKLRMQNGRSFPSIILLNALLETYMFPTFKPIKSIASGK
jgi:hypothetical protein